MQWNLLDDEVPDSIEKVLEVLQKNRSLPPESLDIFYHPKHPLELSLTEVGIDPDQMKQAVDRILLAKEKKEYVLVFGDYDADGVTATAILWETIYEMGVKAMPFIPHREKHGYGISHKAIEDLLSRDKKPDLIITVDNGIVAIEQVKRLVSEGIDVIISDHHMPEQQGHTPHFPPALAIVHTTQLCGATVAWFLARELNRDKAATLLDLCAIGTIADQMILLEANRSFAHHGILALRQTQRIGLQELYSICSIDPVAISTYSINYAIGPRINAMGRLSSAMDALKALCTKNREKAKELMQVLQSTNLERQELTTDMVEDARSKAAQWKDEKIIIVASSQYHEGVIGLIAGRLCEEFSKPAIAIAVGETFAKASARSVKGVNIVELIRQVRDDLLEVGGHPMAAGFGLLPEKIEDMKKHLLDLAREQIGTDLLLPKIDVECVLPMSLINQSFCEEIKTFEPFGNGNSEPIFGLKDVEIVQVYAMGKERKHLKLTVSEEYKQNSSTTTLDCIAFSKGHLEEKLQKNTRIDIAGCLSINEWKGRKNVQMVVKDVNFF